MIFQVNAAEVAPPAIFDYDSDAVMRGIDLNQTFPGGNISENLSEML